MTLEGPVLVVGAGLLGTSIGLALRRRGVDVALRDVSQENLRIATGARRRERRRGRRPRRSSSWSPCRRTTSRRRSRPRCGRPTRWSPTWAASRARRWTRRGRSSTRTALRALRRQPPDGRQRAVRPAAPPPQALFDGRPWAVTPHETADPTRVELVTELARALRRHAGDVHARGARPGRRPHLAPAAPAGRAGRRPAHRRAARRTSRCPARASATSPGSPAGDPALWQQIVTANTDGADAPCCATSATTSTRCWPPSPAATGHRSAPCWTAASQGTAVIPGKHGGPTGARPPSSSPSPTTPASWPGCSPTPARSA